MIVYRMGSYHRVKQLDGAGAKLYGGRWNSPGTAVVYCSSSVSLSALEMLAHSKVRPIHYHIATIELPNDALIIELDRGNLPKKWFELPYNFETQNVGDIFVKERRGLAMRIPSAVNQLESNFILSPDHPEMVNVKIIDVVPFHFDARFQLSQTI